MLVSGPQIESWPGEIASTPPGYTTWAHFHAGGQDPGLDFDGEGVPNAIEYVLGGTATANDLAKLPTAAITGDKVVFTFIRDQASIDGVTTLDIQTGDNLFDSRNENHGSRCTRSPHANTSRSENPSPIKCSKT